MVCNTGWTSYTPVALECSNVEQVFYPAVGGSKLGAAILYTAIGTLFVCFHTLHQVATAMNVLMLVTSSLPLTHCIWPCICAKCACVDVSYSSTHCMRFALPHACVYYYHILIWHLLIVSVHHSSVFLIHVSGLRSMTYRRNI